MNVSMKLHPSRKDLQLHTPEPESECPILQEPIHTAIFDKLHPMLFVFKVCVLLLSCFVTGATADKVCAGCAAGTFAPPVGATKCFLCTKFNNIKELAGTFTTTVGAAKMCADCKDAEIAAIEE